MKSSLIRVVNILNQLRLFIDSSSGGKQKTKDIMAIVIIAYFSTIIAGMTSLGKKSGVLEELINVIKSFLENIESLRNFSGNEVIMKYPEFSLNFSMEIELSKYMFLTVATFFIVGLINRRFKMKRIYLMMILMFIQVVISSIFFKDTIPLLLIVGILLSIIIYFVPLGNGAYFNIIEYCSFLADIYPFTYKELSKKDVAKFVLRIILPVFPFLLFMKMLVPSMTLYVISITYVATLLLIFLNSNENKVQLIFKKILIYSLIIIVTISNQQKLNGDILEIVLSIFAIFFSLDRVLSAIKNLKSELEDKSMLYLMEKKSEDTDWLIENKEIFSLDMEKIPSEPFLLKQIIICYHLNEKEQLIKLSNMYDSVYEMNKRLVLQLKYFSEFSNDQSDIEERYEYLKKVFKLTKSRIEFFPAVIEYGSLLFLKGENYKMIIDLMSKNWYALDDESKYVLYYAYKQENEKKSAEVLKNEISNFNSVSEEFKKILGDCDSE